MCRFLSLPGASELQGMPANPYEEGSVMLRHLRLGSVTWDQRELTSAAAGLSSDDLGSLGPTGGWKGLRDF